MNSFKMNKKRTENTMRVSLFGFLSVFILVFSSISFAQTIPQEITYQGKLLDNGNPVTGTKSFIFTIGSWTETQSINVVDGIYTATLGIINPIPATVFTSTPNVQLQISVDGNLLSPSTDILSVGYSYQAEQSENSNNLDSEDGTYYLEWGNFTGIPMDLLDGDDVDDADNNPTNEFQSLSINGNDLSISDGNTVTLPSGGGNYVDLTTAQSIGGLKTFTDQTTNFKRYVNIGSYGASNDAQLNIYSNDDEGISFYDKNTGSLKLKMGYDGGNSRNEINSYADLVIDCSNELILESDLRVLNLIHFGNDINYPRIHESSDDLFLQANNGNMQLDAQDNIRIGDELFIKVIDNKVGIGTSNFGAFRLAVNGSSTFWGDMELRDGSSTADVLISMYDNSDDGILEIKQNNSTSIRFHGNGTSYLNGGNVGIGTTSPSYLLQVGNSGDGTSARANGWYTFSDKRWKANIVKIDYSIEKLKKINGYYYNWKDRKNTTKQLGLIAQEVEDVIPEIVSTDNSGYKSIDYSKLTPLLIEAVKQQQEMIEQMQSQIDGFILQLSELELLQK